MIEKIKKYSASAQLCLFFYQTASAPTSTPRCAGWTGGRTATAARRSAPRRTWPVRGSAPAANWEAEYGA